MRSLQSARTSREGQAWSPYRTAMEWWRAPLASLVEGRKVIVAGGPAVTWGEAVDTLRSEPSLKGYHHLPSVRGDLLAKLGRLDEAREEFERAATLTRNARERDLLLERARGCRSG